MRFRTLIFRSLRYRWRAHLGVVLVAAVGSAALIGALVVGDSVRGTLREQALQRLGGAEVALDAGDRFFEQRLADRMRRWWGFVPAAPKTNWMRGSNRVIISGGPSVNRPGLTAACAYTAVGMRPPPAVVTNQMKVRNPVGREAAQVYVPVKTTSSPVVMPE